MRCTKTYDKENKKPVVHQYLSRVKDWLCLIDAHIVEFFPAKKDTMLQRRNKRNSGRGTGSWRYCPAFCRRPCAGVMLRLIIPAGW